MIDHAERLKQMVENDRKRKSQIMEFAIILVILTFALILFTPAHKLSYLPIILIGQLPILYKSWHRMKLLLTFNNEPCYQRLIYGEFVLTIGNVVYLLLMIENLRIERISLITFIIALILGLIVFLAVSFWFDRRLKEIDPDHVKSMELSEAHQRYKKMVRK